LNNYISLQDLTPISRFWQRPLIGVLSELRTGPQGLDELEAIARREKSGPNALRPRGERAVILELLAHFQNPLVVVLLAASVIAAFLGDVRSFVVITLIVLLSVLLDFVQEYRAGRAIERLRSTVAVRTTVVRGGQPREVPIAELVPGDIVLLSAGDLVPADGCVMEACDFFVNQALMTGESYPVEKHAAEVEAGADMTAAANVVLMGTSAVSGSARVVIVRTGQDTALAQIADTLAVRPPATAFERGTQAFGVLILRLTMLLVLFVLLVNAVFHRPLFESFLFAVALAVGLTPELLPMIVSVTLARGALRLTRLRVIVKRLSAIQDLGAIDVLCTDKTGTLTEGHIRLERHVDPSGRDSARVLEFAYLNSYFETGIRSPLDDAILRHEHLDVSAWRKVDEVPFDFERRRVSVLVERDHRRTLVVKGSPEDVLRLCARYESSDGTTSSPLDEATRVRILNLYGDYSREGFRVLGVAWREVPADHNHAGLADERALVFAGFAAFLDPPKASAAQALATLAASGVALKIVTGDNELVTRHICTELRLPILGVLSGTDIQSLDDHALLAQVERVNLFCRVTPAQKTRILSALRARGHIVGFLGDGINDAPSLHAADVGISVDSAVDVAKEAADLILLDQDLNVLQDGVREGRRTFGNVMKYIMMGTSSNFGNMFSMAGGTLMLPFLPMLPIQILLNNFLYDLSEIAIPFDNVEEDTLARPHAWDMDFVRRFMLTLGPVSSVFDFLTFFVLLHVFHAGEALFHTGWFIESISTQVLVIFIIRTRGNPFANRPNAWLVVLSLAVVAIAAVLPLTPAGTYLGFVPPPPGFYMVVVGIVLTYLVAVQVAKRAFYLRWDKPPVVRGQVLQ
jgi:Mg2+-importing ATPase